MGDKGIDIPTTDAYEINLDVDISNPLLADGFNDAVFGVMETDALDKMVHSLVKTEELKAGFKVSFSDEKRSTASVVLNQIDIGMEGDIAVFMGVKPDNLPPNIPDAFTEELYHHLMALHESEHMSQMAYDLDPSGQYVNTSTLKSKLVVYGEDASLVADGNIKEADSDNAVLEHLDDMGYEHLSQFWLDGRMVASFMHGFGDSQYDIYEHDTASLLSYYRETGEIIDIDKFAEEKGQLMATIRSEFMGADMTELRAVMDEYPPLTSDELHRLSDITKNKSDKMEVTPQRMMHTVQGLLERDELDGLQKWEAQNYIETVERLGYEPDSSPAANVSMVDKIRDVMENDFGKKPLGAEPTPSDPVQDTVPIEPAETMKL